MSADEPGGPVVTGPLARYEAPFRARSGAGRLCAGIGAGSGAGDGPRQSLA